MSDVLFPELPGLEWDLTKTPMFNTKIMQSVNGRELRASYQAVPKYQISMSFAFLRESKGRNELQQLEGFFLERRGSFDSFLFKMPEDNEFQCTFVGDGVQTSFQLYKQINTTQIPLQHTQAEQSEDPLMWSENASKPMWSDPESQMWLLQFVITNNGMLQLSIPLLEGESITVTGTFYYRCRFADDEQQYTNFMSKLWKAGKVEMIGSLGNKV
ncbi:MULTISPECIES: DUF2460 domain-containing protein [Acinetobacter calcoaceticus/baumannii complex]|uniref:DUF2460 domain-containing protein n=4 Tax=Acinetobacter calcoaceticus/baumannii complex TaxID=909768 RepID=A0A3R9YZI4_ACIBA|nr:MULTISPECIES: DUF2460 domain-containing protein [Acinetobacter calcoaceticus/baumannii complex]MDQ9826113.1 DUF2460 domain-containing protein [Acinetobacter sp. 163]EXE50174.1 hypothetical protein J576_2083 [Acinetobacter sp. 766875]KQD32961.1 hypothetical protein APD13_05555 [Acinetobacter pittii]KQF54998.1 hypothetical protein APC13_00645 [Acinetobacter pittii]MBD0492576.1 hypothetical protein [Acinetobacter baumannii]